MRRSGLIAGALSVVLAGAWFWCVRAWLTQTPVEWPIAGQHVALLAPQRLALGCVLPLIVYAAWTSLTGLSRAQRALSLALRCTLVATLVVALCLPVRRTRSTRVCTAFIVDVSDSVSAGALAQIERWVTAALRLRADNTALLISVAARPHAHPTDLHASVQAAFARHAVGPVDAAGGAGTDLQAALQLAYGLFPAGQSRRVVVLSDGNETHGSLLQEAERARALGVQVDGRVVRDALPNELAVRAVQLPSRIEVGKRFKVRVQVFSTTPAQAQLRLLQDAVPNGLDAARAVQLAVGDNEITFDSVVFAAGPVEYRAQLQPMSADHFDENNHASASGFAQGKPRVLMIDSDPTLLGAARTALERSAFEVDVRSPEGMPRTLPELSRYDFVLLSDVPAQALPTGSMDVIERYVRDAGGGFMLAGGERSFGPGGYQGTAMEQLLPVRMAAQRRRDEHSLALALVIDCSGSMVGQKIELAKEAAKATADVLGDADSIEVIGFAGQPERRVRMQSASNRVGIGQSIARLYASGGTQIFPALDMAYQDLSATQARLRHVILLTDGQTQESGIEALVQALRADAITLTTVGLGNDVNRNLLQTAANLGGGRAYFTNDPKNVPRIFVDETTSLERQSTVDELVSISVREPADFLKGVDLAHAPMLRGYVATQAKDKPAQVILQSELGEPVLARWHVGLGQALAWTTDLKGHWTSDLLRWPGFARLLGQLVREHVRAGRADDLPMQVEVTGDVAHAVVDAWSADDRFLDGLQSELRSEPPTAADLPQDANPKATAPQPLLQTAPGRYEAIVPLPSYGTITLHAVHRRDGVVIAHSHAQAAHPYPTEYAALAPNAALLKRIAGLTGGMTDPTPAQIWRPAPAPVQTQHALWPWLLATALALFLVDLWVRRVRLFDRTFR